MIVTVGWSRESLVRRISHFYFAWLILESNQTEYAFKEYTEGQDSADPSLRKKVRKK